MRSRRCLLVALGLWMLLSTAPRPSAQEAAPGRDIQSWATANISSLLSFGGSYVPVEPSTYQAGASFVAFWNVVRLGAEQREGVAFAGWQYNGGFNLAQSETTQTRAGLFEQQPDGTLADATERVLGDPATDGIGEVLVADFNRDGRDDLFLSTHNESPQLWRSSVAFMSRPDGGLSRMVLADQAANHDARVFTVNGIPKVIANSLQEKGPTPRGSSFGTVYAWNGTGFTVNKLGNIGGLAAVVGALTGDDQRWLVVGDAVFGPGLPRYTTSTVQEEFAYKFNNDVQTLPAIALPKPYFNNKPEFAQYVSFWDPVSKTHTPRIYITDLNQDGLPDVIPYSTIWQNTNDGMQKSVLQLLLNHGNMQFTDDTDALAPEYDQDSIIDYSLRLVDVDGSGIDTFFSATSIKAYPVARDAGRHGNYILVNDGTGRLYAAMHDEFRALGAQVLAYVRARRPNGLTPSQQTPQFIPYRTPDGAINFAVVVGLTSTAYTGVRSWAVVGLHTQINLTTDVRRDITVAGRNSSRRIRTFAGNDTIHRALTDPDCAIDGGLGTNVVVYPGPQAQWSVVRSRDSVSIRPATGPGGVDTLTRIQIARFADGDVDLTN